MATLGITLVVAAFLSLQFLASREIDRRLPKKWKRLPVFGPYGRSPAKRRAAIFDHFWLTGPLGVCFVALGIKQDLDPQARTDGEMIIAATFVMVLMMLIYLLRRFMLLRWVRTGKPRIEGLAHPAYRKAQ